MDFGREIRDAEAMASNLERGLSANLVMPSNCSIFKIPTILSRHLKHAYVPNAFSIGPFHREKLDLKPTERIKQKYLLDLVSRLTNPNQPISQNPITPDPKFMRNFTNAINNFENDARGYYAGTLDMKADDFVEMLVLDGCFIIELFRKNAYSNLRDKNDPIFTMSCMLQFLSHDLILLENQIPWFVLDILFDLTHQTPSIHEKSLVQLAIEFFRNLFTEKPPPIQLILSKIQNHEHKHILDLLRSLLVSKSSIRNDRSNTWKRIPSASNLQDSGIKFKRDSSSESILDIKFLPKGGVIMIPPLLIQETTETVFRNLISLEQCCPNYEPIVTSYAVLLDNLIDTNTDIQILEKKETIINWMNIDDATKLFNRLYTDTYVNKFYYCELTSEVNSYCKNRWPKYRRVLMRDYFKHPWAQISVIAASIALFLTFLQTLYAMKG